MKPRIALVLLAYSAALAIPGATRPRNIVENGSFTRAERGGGGPAGWASSGSSAVGQRLTLDFRRGGGRCARLECSVFPPSLMPDDHAMLSQAGRIGVLGGRWHRISFWARANGIVSRVVSLALVDTERWQPVGLDEQFVPDGRWQRFEFSFLPRSDLRAERGRLQFWFTSTGTLWIDDVVLEETDREPEWFPRIAPGGVKNLLPNSSFECGSSGWGSLADGSPGSGGGGGDIGRLEAEIDASQNRHGSQSLRIALRRDSFPVLWLDHYEPVRHEVRRVLAANQGWIEVVPGQPLTLSAFLRGDAEGLVARMAVVQPHAGVLRQDVPVGLEWRRATFTFTPVEHSLFVAVGLDLPASGLAEGTLWLDAIQLERGREATAFETRQPVEAFVEPVDGPIDTAGRDMALRLRAFNGSNRQNVLRGQLTVQDFFDRTVLTRSATLAVSPRSSASTTLPIPLGGRRGFFRASWRSSAGSSTLRLASIEPSPPETVDSPFGFNHAYPWDFLVREARSAGIVWWRDWSAKWQTVEPEKDTFDFTATDRMNARLRGLGGRIDTLLPVPSSAWSSSASGEELARGSSGGHAPQQLAATFAPRDPRDFGAYAAALLRHDRGLDPASPSTFEILNEPIVTAGALPAERGYGMADYLRLLRAASEALRREDPSCVVVGGVGAGPSHPLTREFIEDGGLALVDALDLHMYGPPRPAESYEAEFRALEDAMRSRDVSRPMWITEWGVYADDDPPTRPLKVGDQTMNLCLWPSERAATEQIVKFASVAFAHGVRKIFFHAGTTGRINGADAAGILFEYGGTPRKMLPGIAAFSRLIGVPDRFLRTVATGSLRADLFHTRAEVVAVVWNRSGRKRSLIPRPHVRVYDIMGNRMSSQRVTVTATPIYLVVPEGSESEIDRSILGGDHSQGSAPPSSGQP